MRPTSRARPSVRPRAPLVRGLFVLLVSGTAAALACGGGEASMEDDSPLLNPGSEAMNETAPETFEARFETSAGDFTVRVDRSLAPQGADRFYNLVRHGYYDGGRFFRVLEGFVAQFGISSHPEVTAAWEGETIPDDPVETSNERGTITFATSGPDTRTTQVFINLEDNARLDGMGFAPFGRVVDGMEVVESLHAGYGEGAPRGAGPAQDRIESEGEAYLEEEFPELDRIERAYVL